MWEVGSETNGGEGPSQLDLHLGRAIRLCYRRLVSHTAPARAKCD